VITNAEFIAAARSWLGVPYLHQGRSRLGVDCVGFLACCAADMGVLPAPVPANYGRVQQGALKDYMVKYGKPAPAAAAGVVVVIRWPQAVHAAHIALCTGPTILQCYEIAGGVIETRYGAPWTRLTDSFWRFPGVVG
jgi:cell wall-associated NlpC family hydrolase